MIRETVADIRALLESLETDSDFRKDAAGYFMEWECAGVVTHLRICAAPYLTAYKEGKRVHRKRFTSVEHLRKTYARAIQKTLETK